MIPSRSDLVLAGICAHWDVEPWTVPEAARRLEVSERSIRSLVREWVKLDRVIRLDRGVYRCTLPTADDMRVLQAIFDGGSHAS